MELPKRLVGVVVATSFEEPATLNGSFHFLFHDPYINPYINPYITPYNPYLLGHSGNI